MSRDPDVYRYNAAYPLYIAPGASLRGQTDESTLIARGTLRLSGPSAALRPVVGLVCHADMREGDEVRQHQVDGELFAGVVDHSHADERIAAQVSHFELDISFRPILGGQGASPQADNASSCRDHGAASTGHAPE